VDDPENGRLRPRLIERAKRAAFDRIPVAAAILLPDGRIAAVNDALIELSGRTRAELVGSDATLFAAGGDGASMRVALARMAAGELEHYDAERRFTRGGGSEAVTIVHVGVVRDPDGRVESLMALLEDITARKQAEAQLVHRASHDELTGLHNRSGAIALVQSALDSRSCAGVLYLDLDRFKIVNDTLGHHAGDELLIEVAERWATVLPAGYELARVGGDEFVVVAAGVPDRSALRAAAVALRDRLIEPFDLHGHRHSVGVSIGIAVAAPGASDAATVFHEADQAMLRAKREERDGIEEFDSALDHTKTVADLELEEALRESLANGRDLELRYQPIVEIGTRQPVGFEALVRWHHPERGLMDPAAFLSAAEENGLIVELGWWVLRRACADVGSGELSSVSINVAPGQLGKAKLVPALHSALADTGVHPGRLCLEFAEATFVDADETALAEIRAAAALGVRIAVDNFGSRYSPMAVLGELPIAIVKIDRSSVAALASDDGSAIASVTRVLALCDGLSIAAVGLGVERDEQLQALAELGCPFVQGYLLGAPEPLMGGARGQAASV
jgi:diguanylate cyclase (GGDEF)-like protein/PAS domain S-box-containing protein